MSERELVLELSLEGGGMTIYRTPTDSGGWGRKLGTETGDGNWGRKLGTETGDGNWDAKSFHPNFGSRAPGQAMHRPSVCYRLATTRPDLSIPGESSS
jgi:hypothetical protein